MAAKAHLLDSPEQLASPDDYRAFVSGSWPILAALAWKGYQSQGRGALFVPQNLIRRGLDGFTAQAHFVAVGPDWPEDVAAVADQYDPSDEILMVFTEVRTNEEGQWKTDGVWNMERYRSQDAHFAGAARSPVSGAALAPPEAFERLLFEL